MALLLFLTSQSAGSLDPLLLILIPQRCVSGRGLALPSR